MKNEKKRKIIITASFLISAIVVVINYIGTYGFCDYIMNRGHEGYCPFYTSDATFVLFPILPLFLFSLIVYKMREEMYESWWKFTRVFIPLSMLAILVSPSISDNSFLPIEKGVVSSFTSLSFVIASILIIISRYHSLKKNRQYPSVVMFGIFLIAFIIAVTIFIVISQMF